MTYLVSNRYTIYRQMICFFLLLSRALYLPRGCCAKCGRERPGRTAATEVHVRPQDHFPGIYWVLPGETLVVENGRIVVRRRKAALPKGPPKWNPHGKHCARSNKYCSTV